MEKLLKFALFLRMLMYTGKFMSFTITVIELNTRKFRLKHITPVREEMQKLKGFTKKPD